MSTFVHLTSYANMPQCYIVHALSTFFLCELLTVSLNKLQVIK